MVGGTNINTIFATTSGSRSEIIDNVAAKLAYASGSYISG